jgi:cobalt-zinc-cadmium efflux system outer membrane protein
VAGLDAARYIRSIKARLTEEGAGDDMRFVRSIGIGCVLVAGVVANAAAQASLTWTEVRARFEANNPTLRAGTLGIDESRADEVTAYLRPNPGLSVPGFLVNLRGVPPDTGRFQNQTTSLAFDYLIERGHKRELRRDSARAATRIAESTQTDLVRTLSFTLRSAFIQVLQAKAFLGLAQQNLKDYDQVLAVSLDRLRGGDISRVDLDRLQLQRVQYESDVQTATVNVRTAKIQLLQLLNDQEATVEAFDVTGPFDFMDPGRSLADLRQIALARRPDLLAAREAVDKAKVDHRLAIANGSTDPDVGATVAWQPSAEEDGPENVSLGIGVSIPLRIFDRNQGEKQKTRIDITRNERLSDATRAQVVGDVDSAYATLMSTVALLEPYKAVYLAQSTRVRDTVQFSFQRGGAALLDFLQAQQDYRSVQLNYVNLVAAFLNAASQLNLAVGQEVIP